MPLCLLNQHKVKQKKEGNKNQKKWIACINNKKAASTLFIKEVFEILISKAVPNTHPQWTIIIELFKDSLLRFVIRHIPFRISQFSQRYSLFRPKGISRQRNSETVKLFRCSLFKNLMPWFIEMPWPSRIANCIITCFLKQEVIAYLYPLGSVRFVPRCNTSMP